MAQQRKRQPQQPRQTTNRTRPTPQKHARQTTQEATRQKQNLQLRRALHDVFAHAQETYAMDTIGDILDSITTHGIDMAAWADTARKSRKDLEREVQLMKLEKFLRDYKERGRRVIRYGKGKWFHLTGKLYLQTRLPETPDANIRRDEMVSHMAGVVKFLDRYRRGYVKNIEGTKATIRQVRDGEVFEQPKLLSEEQAD